MANSVSAVLNSQRVLNATSSGPIVGATVLLALFALIAIVWPALIGWPLGVLAAWFALNLGIASWRTYRRRRTASARTAERKAPG